MALQQPQCDEEQRQLGADRSADLQQILSQFLLRRTQQVTDPNVEKKKEKKRKRDGHPFRVLQSIKLFPFPRFIICLQFYIIRVPK